MGDPQTTKKMLDPSLMKSCQTGGLDGGVWLNTFHVPQISHHFVLSGYLKNNVYAIKPTTISKLRATIKRECTQIPK